MKNPSYTHHDLELRNGHFSVLGTKSLLARKCLLGIASHGADARMRVRDQMITENDAKKFILVTILVTNDHRSRERLC